MKQRFEYLKGVFEYAGHKTVKSEGVKYDYDK